MAKYFLHVKTFSRSKGSRATKAAAYRAGERIRDERTGDSYNFSHREDVAHKEIVLAADFASRPDMQWALNRAVLWNAAEHAGRLRNARVAREVLVILPPELSAPQRVALVRRFSQELANRYRNAVDFAVHEPKAGSDERHHHAHMLMTTREVTAHGLGPRTILELSGTERHARGFGPTVKDLVHIRERWAEVTNEALQEAGLTARIDHRSYQAQGLNQEPKPAIPQSVYYAEKNTGVHQPAGDAIRQRYHERLEARRLGGDALERVLRRQREEGHHAAVGRSQAGKQETLARGALTRKELNEKRRGYAAANRDKINRQQRERRQANVAEANRKQREYLRQRTADKAAQREATAAAPTRARHAAATAALRENGFEAGEGSSTAQASVDNWLAYRAHQKDLPEAEKSVSAWLAYRDGKHPAEVDGAGGERSRDSDDDGQPDEDPEREKNWQREQDLEL